MKVCAKPGCPELTDSTHCPLHARAPWQGSTRRERLPKDWDKRRTTILRRDRYACQQCGAKATDVDHINPGDDHRYTNLQALCSTCHTEKTKREAANARRG